MHMHKTFSDTPEWNQPSQVKTVHMQQKHLHELNQVYKRIKTKYFMVEQLTFW